MPAFEMKVAHKGILLVAVPLIFELLFVGVLWSLLYQTEQEVRREAYARKVSTGTRVIAQHILDFMVGAATYGMSGSKVFMENYKSAVENLPGEFDRLTEVFEGRPEKQEQVRRIRKNFTRAVKMANKFQIRIGHGETARALALLPELKMMSQEASDSLHDLGHDERLVEMNSFKKQARLRESVKFCLFIGVLLNIGISVVLVAYFTRSITGRLRTMTDNSARLAAGRQLNEPIFGGDELAVLDRSFHQMANALAEATRKERAMVENAQDVICSVSKDAKFMQLNPASTSVWGYFPEELVGSRIGRLMPADDNERFQNALKSLVRGESVFPLETTVRRKDGSEGSFVWSAHWSADEEVFSCVSHDITERKTNEKLVKSAEARLRAIVENMPIGLAMVTASGVIEMSNPSLSKMFDLGEGRNLVGRSIDALFRGSRGLASPDEKAESLQFVPADLIGQVITCSAFSEVGRRFPVELGCHSIETQEGTKFMILIVDVSDREEIERLKQEFVMILSHELRSPLTSLKMLLELLSDGAYGDLTEKGVAKLAVADRNITRLVKLIQELLDFETIESEKLNMELRQADMKDTLERAVEASRGPAAARKIELVARLEPLTVLGDEDRIIQVVINLVSNAVKYSPDKGTVRITCDREDSYAVVRVIDQGPGIAEEHRQVIFERFKQVDPAGSKGKGNVGLGLAISRAIVERHGGIIGVDSQIGKGSTFYFKIPLISSSSDH